MAPPREIGTYTQVQRDRYVTLAVAIGAADNTLTHTAVAARAAKEGTKRGDTVPSAHTLLRWVREAGVELAKRDRRPTTEPSAVRGKRETQRARLISLIDLEINRTARVIRTIANQMRRHDQNPALVDEIDPSISTINFAQRLQALASAHATLATQSRADELHGLRMGDINPDKPASSLDDWDGDPERLPEDLPEGIIDIEGTRRRAAAISSGGA